MHTSAVEDYLKATYEIARLGGRVTTSALAERLGVTPASVTGMVKKLAAMRLVKHERYHGFKLTPSGRRIAIEMIRHHRLVETYLHDALGMPWDQIHDEAERWEHVLSEDLEARMDAALGHPTTDPHGSPIPSPELDLVEEDHPPLLRLDEGQCGVIAEVSDDDPELLRYFGGLGLFPGTACEVVTGPPYVEGPVTIRLLDGDRAGTEVSVGHRAAAHLFMRDIE
jgi:DtxR family Mn-dependent transcriptional regulator